MNKNFIIIILAVIIIGLGVFMLTQKEERAQKPDLVDIDLDYFE